MGALIASGHAFLTLFLSGDVMIGRGIDQVRPSSVDPLLFELYVKSATDYVHLAERLDRECARFGGRVERNGEGELVLRW